MKKVTLIALVLVAASLVFVGVAMANAGPHGDYTATTDKCAGCHRAHTAGTARLLVGSGSVSDFCLVCHGVGVSGADTDVVSGLYANRNTNYDPSVGAGQEVTASTYISTLLGGGFEYYRVQGTLSTTVTSRHDVNVTGWAGAGTTAAPGALETGVNGALGFTFECTSCHDPHGNDNYRILNTSATITSTSTITDIQTTKDYTHEEYGAGISRFCAQCHPAYHATAQGAGSTSGPGNKFRHRIDMVWNNPAYSDVNWDSWTKNPDTQGYWDGAFTYTLPLFDGNSVETPDSATDTYLNCLTCHLAHGTSASMSGFADPNDPSASAFVWTDSDSPNDGFLLRLPNRGVCQVCHQKDPVPTQP